MKIDKTKFKLEMIYYRVNKILYDMNEKNCYDHRAELVKGYVRRETHELNDRLEEYFRNQREIRTLRYNFNRTARLFKSYENDAVKASQLKELLVQISELDNKFKRLKSELIEQALIMNNLKDELAGRRGR